uniref:C-CAP/cofactor C-like domain-containing protein n=1 Tax=Biomphalaria glabrata TaxID=6526 RepID=A0A2C9JGU1_BIOGL
MASKHVSIWVKAEPFSYGTIPVAPHPRLNSTNIRKIVVYSKNKGSAGFPRLSYTMWQHIACNKLHLSEDLAWMYFQTCQFFTQSISPVECIEKDEKLAKIKDQHDRNKMMASESVDLYKFVIFLSMQQLYRMSLRTSLVAGDEWPSTSSSATTCERSVTIEKCRNTTLILGPVEVTVHVSGCENVTIIAPCRNFMISGSTLCTLYLLIPNRPLILSGNDTIMLAPYHTFYPSLEEHMLKAGIGIVPNKWDQPLCIGPDHREDQPVWQILPESEFYPFSVPFEMQGSTKSIPCSLPAHYQKELNKRQKQIDTWQHMVKDAGLSREQRKEFQTLVESRFHIWLSETGHKRELDSLVVPLQAVSEKK